MDLKISGKVVKGLHIGSEIGFPTINIKLKKNSKNIEFGVYICEIKKQNLILKGVLHYGPKTIGSNRPDEIFCEVHILNFNEDLYTCEVEIKLLKKIRDVRKFMSKENLQKQIAKDVNITKKYFNV